jgi:hypothetical protein
MAIEVTSIQERRHRRIIKKAGQVFKHGAHAARLRKRRLIIQAIIAAFGIQKLLTRDLPTDI